MAIVTNSEHRAIAQAPISVSEVHERLTAKAIEIVRAIVADNTKRMDGYKQDITLLNSGVFSANEYFKALKNQNQKTNLDYFLNKGSFYHGFASPKHFDMLRDPLLSPTRISFNHFVLKKGVTASAALDAMRQGLSFIGSGEICQIAHYEAIKDVLGTEKFDLLFAADSSTPLRFNLDAEISPLTRLQITIGSPKIISKGQIVQFENTPLYQYKHINGDAGGCSALCCDDNPGKETFITPALHPNGVTHAEVSQKFLEEFNQTPVGMEIVTEEVAKRILGTYTRELISQFKKLEAVQLSAEEFAKGGGGRIVGSVAFNADRITQLANLSVKEARKQFDQWQKTAE